MKTINFNTELLNDFFSVGSYGAWDDWCIDSINEFVPDVIEIGSRIVRDIFEDAGIHVSISHAVFKSPEYYNYSNDWIEFDLEYNPDQLQRVILTQINDSFYDYIKSRFTSSDGFISSIPNNKEDFIISLLSDDPYKAIAAFMSWYNRNDTSYQDDLYYSLQETEVYYNNMLEMGD